MQGKERIVEFDPMGDQDDRFDEMAGDDFNSALNTLNRDP